MQESKLDTVEEIEPDFGLIKLPKKYASVLIDKEIFKIIIYSILNRKEDYGTDYIAPRKIENKFDTIIQSKANYTTSYHVIINVIKYLKDFHFVDKLTGTKKGKYTVVDDNSLKMRINK